MQLHGRALQLIDASKTVLLTLNYWWGDAWQPLPFSGQDGVYCADTGEVSARLELSGQGDVFQYTLRYQAYTPIRLQLRLEMEGASEPFHVIPGCIFGDNNMADSLGKAPNLTTLHPDNPSCSPYWELRADRASLPISMLSTPELAIAVSIDPYASGRPDRIGGEAAGADDFIRNGLFAEVAHNNSGDACGVTLGYAQLPNFWDGERLPVIGHTTTEASTSGRIYLQALPEGVANPRLAVHDFIRREYPHHRETPAAPITQDAAIGALVDAFVTVNWHDETGRNALGSKPPRMGEFFAGVDIKENFTNMRCSDDAKTELTAWRTLCEIGWSGGSAIADPLLTAGQRLGNAAAVAHATKVLDRIAGAINPASGLLWDVVGKYEGNRVNWWWSGYMVMDCHCGYTNGNAVWHLLKAYRNAHECDGSHHANWLETACSVLDTAIELQRADGKFGYTFAIDRREVLDWNGFAGVWFVAALALAYHLTGKENYLDAARKGAEYYHGEVTTVSVCGGPMDQFKWPDHEGNLGFIRALPLLHRITGDQQYLAMLTDAAHYEYLWRYGQRTRPQSPPLKDSHWNSCGGSTSGVFTWQHPMGMFVNADLLYLAEQTGDDYHRQRAEDSIAWGINTVSIYPEVAGYGIRGVMTECYCQSNPRPGQFNGDGTPATLWHSYNGWAAAATLEGLLEV